MSNAIPPSLRGIIAGQAGVVSRQQVLRGGLPASTVASTVRHGLWQQLHPGVYGAFTGTVTWKALLC